MSIQRILAALSGGLTVALAVPVAVSAAAPVVVTPSNTQGWSSNSVLAETRANGHVNFVNDTTAPLGQGALQLSTDAIPAPGQDKAQYMHAADVSINDVTQLAYSTSQLAASNPGGDASYQLAITTSTGFTTLVYEPYWQNDGNPDTAPVQPNDWQTWQVDQGLFWSSRNLTCTNGSLAKGAGGPPFYTLEQIQTMCPEATIVGFGVNVGSGNPGYTINVDKLVFNDTTYNFEPTVTAANKDACKNDGWKTSNTPVYKNQGDCVSSFASNGKAGGNPSVVSAFTTALSKLF